MSLNLQKSIFRYFKKILPIEIQIDKEEIFLRKKYDEIINYIKMYASDGSKEELHEIIKPNGRLLINVNQGSDLVNYLKLIAKNFQLGILLLDEKEIQKDPKDFLKNLSEFKFDFEGEPTEAAPENVEEELKDSIRTWIVLIEEKHILNEIFNEKNLLQKFLDNFSSIFHPINFLEHDVILIWVCYDFKEIHRAAHEIFKFFDLLVNIPILSDQERESYLRSILEMYPKISFDLQKIIEITKNWEVCDILNFIKIGIIKHYIKSDLNYTSNEISEVLIKTLDNNEFIPSNTSIINLSDIQASKVLSSNDYNTSQKWESRDDLNHYIQSYIKEIKEGRYSDFMENQLYESAASKNYNELVLIIDKLTNNEKLEENDRNILSEFPFILKDSPNKAQLKLEKAKKSIDQIKQFFDVK